MKIKKNIFFFVTAISLFAGSSFRPAEAGNDEQEYVLKAAFLYRFTDYIDWGSSNPTSDFTIAILGKSGITPPLIEIAKAKKVQGKRIIIKEYDAVDDISSCQIVFVSANYKPGIETAISRLANKPALIITEEPDACEKGAHINFLISDNKLKFEININATETAGLKISSQLLEHAILVNTP
jgi:hypothetical protein